nr:putative sporulation protein YtxC [Cohnella lubricantis]
MKTGHALAEYLVTEKEPSLLRSVMHKQFGLRADGIETDVLISEAIVLMDGEPEAGSEAGRGRARRIRKWGRVFAAFLKDHSHMHLDGFIRFRLKEYFAEIREAAETALEERAMERQYQEFVTLLQSMVQWQEVRLPAVHLLHSGGHAFRMYDEKMRPLERDEEEVDESLAETRGEGVEDQEESMLVSRLLAASPRHLYIYTPEPDAQVIRTLLGIFGERAAICPKLPT